MMTNRSSKKQSAPYIHIAPSSWASASSLACLQRVMLVQDAMLQLWCHETFRIIGDRMWDPTDRTWLKGQLDDKLKAIFGTSWNDLFGEGKECPPFVSFMRTTENPPYEPVTDLTALKVRTYYCNRKLHVPCSAPAMPQTQYLLYSLVTGPVLVNAASC